MRSRLAITAMLVVGVLMSGAGAGLAVSGVSGSGSAGSAQYTTTTSTTLTTAGTTETTDTQTVAPTTETNTPTDTDTTDNGDEDEQGTDPAQATRQLESNGGDSLPFTGYAAIPVLLMGLGLLTAGMLMRRRMSSDQG